MLLRALFTQLLTKSQIDRQKERERERERERGGGDAGTFPKLRHAVGELSADPREDTRARAFDRTRIRWIPGTRQINNLTQMTQCLTRAIEDRMAI